jgi:hypothetical protein
MGFEDLGQALITLWQKPEKEAAEKVASELQAIGFAFGATLATNIYDKVSR